MRSDSGIYQPFRMKLPGGVAKAGKVRNNFAGQ